MGRTFRGAQRNSLKKSFVQFKQQRRKRSFQDDESRTDEDNKQYNKPNRRGISQSFSQSHIQTHPMEDTQ